MFERLKDDAETPLYNGCIKFTRLSFVLKLYNLKASNGWIDKSFTELLSLLHEMLPEDNVLPKRTYEAKQVLASIGLTHEKIHSCPNNCILFRNEYASLRRCPKYNAKQMTWHAEGRIRDGKLRHPADSLQWKKFDNDHEEFATETRNIHFALATDGMNPHGMQSSTHNLKLLWDNGIEVYDGFRDENFIVKAMLYGTINDFPAYGNLSGYSIKGQCACPICQEKTDYIRLDHCHKNVFMGHCRWLSKNHPFRRMKKAFNGSCEVRRCPYLKSGSEIFDEVKHIRTTFGKPFTKQIPTASWKKLSIFFQLPYWESLYVRHFVDVMHVEKNVCESVIGTLLNIVGKKKDGINARLDLVKLGIRSDLAPVKKGKQTFLPPTACTLSRNEKCALCETLYSVKVPEGYSSNIKSLVSLKDLKLKGLKSHDCQILLENLIPVAIRSILPKKVRMAITKLCFFFKAICSKVIDPGRLPSLQNQIAETLCELEMYFLLSFFDIMVHLTIHLVEETKLCGPVYMRWMYPVERYMKILKGYVKNRSKPEGCITERYLVEEAVEFCSEYLSNVESCGIPKSRHHGRTLGEGSSGCQQIEVPRLQWEQAHLYVLQNTPKIEPYISLHKETLKRRNPTRGKNWITKEHNVRFIGWLQERVGEQLKQRNTSVSELIRWLSKGPCIDAFSYTSYLVNGFTFYTKQHDNQSTM
ncbi:uncharacterized protein LOC113871621 [Abrus precatorius]|uniref:Uncharacterized protein LOC113871621 n=1 Tax=Abrus precatorius TaxID=3816 RepID=A0A8B8M924_ABRPR|nr:uncharacterized protein LOC113871621 [Abrus precatorius]